MNRRVWIIFRKEVGDHLRDRRSLVSTITYALFGPLLMLGMIYLLGNMLNPDETTRQLKIPVQGKENAPMLISYLEQNNVIVTDAPANPREAVKNGEMEVVLIISPEYAEKFSEGKPAKVEVVLDTSRNTALVTIEEINTLLQQYQGQIAAMRLMARGVSPTITQVLNVERVDVATEQSRGFQILNMLPYFLILAIFVGGSPLIIDATAGERERASLEPLLINPVKRWEFVIGKMLASYPFVLGVLIITLVAMSVVFNEVPVEEIMGYRMSLSVGTLVYTFLICLPIMILASALQMIITTFAKTYKEAQTYVQWLPLIPALPGIGLAFIPIKPELWVMSIPTFGQQIIINQLVRGEPISMLNVIVSAAVTLALAGVVIWIAIRLYERENILFEKGK